MRQWFQAVSVLAVMVAGCTSMMQPKQQGVTLPSGFERAYACAVDAMVQMGGTNLHSDKQSGVVSCTMHNFMALTAHVQPEAGQSRVDITGTPIGGHIVVGALNEVDEYLQRLQECR